MGRRFSQRIRKLLSRSARIEVWYLERDLAALRRGYHREMAEARRPGGEGDPEEIASRYSSEEQLTSEELEGVRTERLLRRARTLRVPLPSPRPHGHDLEKGDENWDHGYVMGQWTLTDEGERRLRLAICAEEKAQRETAAFWFSVVTSLIAVATGLVGARTGLIAVQQKELLRLDHMPRISCSVVRPFNQESLIVMNSGSPVRKMKADRIVFFDAQPFSRREDVKFVRYVVDDYYRDRLGEDYEGNQRLAYGHASPPGNVALVRAVTSGLVDSLTSHGFQWAGIGVGRAVRVVYWDWLGTRMEEYFWGNDAAGEPASSMERISSKRWKQLSAAADSVRRRGRRLMCSTATRDADIQRVTKECISAVLN